ncbi:MAG: TRAP transporter small permease [Hyphomicrobiaceae bacterium]|nr:MAG: TRAP transporter small permease [Hyphomicrobiaceae bacterium]
MASQRPSRMPGSSSETDEPYLRRAASFRCAVADPGQAMMLALLNRVASVLAMISDAAARIGVIFVASVLFLQVVLRYVFNTGLPWPEEASRYVMIWVTMLAGSLLVRDEQLISVDFFDKFWPKGLIAYRNAFFRLLLALMLAVLFWVGLDQALFNLRRVTATLEISWFWPYLAIPVGAALMLLNMLLLAIRDLTSREPKRAVLGQELEPLG